MALTTDIEVILERPTCAESAFGRIFYGSKNNVYFSQIMEGEIIEALSLCYQKNDPTAEQLNNLLDTDGGSVQIDGAINIKEIKLFGRGVMVYCDNGVWHLSGPDSGFTATSYSVNKISKSGCVSAESVVVVEDTHYYWSEEGIYQVSINEFGRAIASNIVENTTQTFYNNILPASKARASGTYNRLTKQVEWHYASGLQTAATAYKEAKDLSVVLETKAGGLWPQSYNTTLVEAEGDFIVGGVNTTLGTEASDEMKVIINVGAVTSTQSYGITFGNKTSTSFQDFSTDYPTAYIETGHETLGKPSNKKTAPYLTTHFRQTEENWIADGSGGFELDLQSGCQMRAKWDWNNSSANGRFSPPQEVYRFRRLYLPTQAEAFDSGETVITTKNKILGRGQALSIRFEQEAGKDMQLLGYTAQWSVKGKM